MIKTKSSKNFRQKIKKENWSGKKKRKSLTQRFKRKEFLGLLQNRFKNIWNVTPQNEIIKLKVKKEVI